MENRSKLLVILTGKTAAGKDSVMAKILPLLPDFKRVITTTSRKIRDGEQNGVDYNFISEPDFRQKIQNSDFIEYVEYAGNLYGTEKNQILDNLGSSLIWRIDPSRAGQIKEFIKGAFKEEVAKDLLRRVLVIYLTTDDEVILQRLKKRGLSQEEIDKRMQEDTIFWQKFKTNYDHVVENIPGKLSETVDAVVNLIKKH